MSNIIPWDRQSYPPVGKIANMGEGSRVEILHNESESDDCFTGLFLRKDATYAQSVVFDLSVMWDRTKIQQIEEPTEADRKLMSGLA